MEINGKAIARTIIESLQKLPKPEKSLAAIFVGDNAQSQSFLKQKEKIANELGIIFQLHRFPETISEKDLITHIKNIGDDDMVGGMIVQLPLPATLNRDTVISAINPSKDVDALTFASQKLVDPLPVAVVKDILKNQNIDITNKIVVVVGRGFLVGKPIADYFNTKCKELIVLHSKSDLSDLKNGDIVITGVGKGGLITPEMLKSGACVIDFGYDIKEVKSEKGKVESKIVGDFNPMSHVASHMSQVSGWYTPTPGGTGPILVAEIFKNFYCLSKESSEL
ncbi:MAG: bifunctional 5,10-methylenetetrahydrofolate dehydrogenase/5,10-methenyltetrahydrofolate cyclohydrolase [bacterium]|nr:bifunctional 5,10-methylenetetrahydrofolate dehydrogenase/5,10-methenyltetrahydrofolate cyclohydrolase [bacterium]